MLPRQCGAGSYADYGSGSHRWHVHRLEVVPRAVLRAAIFTKFGCHRPYMIHANNVSGGEIADCEKIVPLLLSCHISPL